MEDFQYVPNMVVVNTARAFIRSLCETYGHDRGMAVWDHIRSGLGEQIASDIFLGMLTGTSQLTLSKIGDRYIETIKELRHLTGMGLKEAKDLCDDVRYNNNPRTINVSDLDERKVETFIANLQKFGCVVK